MKHNKKYMVILCGGYYPMPSATGVCADLYSSLFDDSYDIDVICGTNKISLDSYEYKGKHVYPIGSKFFLFQKRLQDKKNIFLLNLSKIPLHVLGWIWHPNILHWYVKCGYNKLRALNKIRKIDVIMSFGAPMSSHAVAKKFKEYNPSIKWIAISFDSYGSQNGNNRRHCKYEKHVLDAADHVFVSEEIFDNCDHLVYDRSDKYSPLPYLINTQNGVKKEAKVSFSDDEISIVYAGSFYKDIRNPEYLLKTAMKLKKGVVLHLFCSSDCDKLINDYIDQSDGRIVRHPIVQQDEIISIYEKSDFLINVGNNLAQFKPSKTFEYMSSLKPIINYYYDGFYDKTLAQYPFCLQIKIGDDINFVSDKLNQFILTYSGKVVKKEQLEALLAKHGPDNIKKTISLYL